MKSTTHCIFGIFTDMVISYCI